ncbi:unnamed protein product [Calypogeia fissa]
MVGGVMGGGGGGGGGKQGKVGQYQQQGWKGVAEQVAGTFSSKLTMVIGVGCICSCAYVVLLLVSSHPCAQSYAGTSAVPETTLLQTVNMTKEVKSLARNVVKESSAETSLERIVFGIGASASMWKTRRQFINKWWKKGKTRGYVWFDSDLGEVWDPEMDPEYKVSENTSHFRYTHKTGSRAAIRISRIVSESYRLGLPNVDWFVMGDDDTFFFTENLVAVLSKYDPKKLWYIGKNSEDHIQNQLFSYSMAYGGGGFAISYALAKTLAETQDDCIHRYPWLYGSDDRMKACVSELGVPLTKEGGFHQFDVRGDAQGLLSAHPLTPIISLHHLEAIYPLFPNHTRPEALAHLTEALSVSPYDIFQQAICYDSGKNWSFSVSSGYVINVYKGFIPPTQLEVPTITFLSWHRRRESYAFPFSTQPRAREICEEPSSYYMEQANGRAGGSIQISYKKNERINRTKVCQQKLLPMSLVENIFVESEKLGREWVENPRRQCCRVMEVNEESIRMQVGACRAGETLVS